MLTWIMFLKFLDDMELQRAEEAKLAGKPHPAYGHLLPVGRGAFKSVIAGVLDCLRNE
jgi:hypothetical protein